MHENDTPPLDRATLAQQEITRRRARAYADPIAGSDVIFAKAVRLQAMGRHAEADQVQQQAIQRFEQIQRDYPMPPDADADQRKPRTTLTMRQARLYLEREGLLAQVDSMIGALDAAAQIEWQYSTTVEISSPIVQFMAHGLGLTEQQVQGIFDEASAL